VKAFLSREGHAFVERNVDEDDGAYDELVRLGWRTVPVTFVGARGVRGFVQDELRALLAG
jgi:glutaredoxin